MKVKILSLSMALIAIFALFSLASCKEEGQYDALDSKGYTISVKFDAGGGMIKGADSTVIDAYNPNNYEANAEGKIEISLIAPDDERRDKNNRLTISKPGEQFIGWYTEKNFKNGVDDTEGYIYSGLWNFETDKLILDKNGNYTSAVSQLTLYAAWAPKFTFNIYTKGENGENILLETKEDFKLNLPFWKNGATQISMADIKTRRGYTFDKIYSDDGYSELIDASSVTGVINKENGTVEQRIINLYTTWLDGTHYRIYKPSDLASVTNDAVLHILSDLDFTDSIWTLSSMKFDGKLYGNGHKISNVSFETTYANSANGLFAEIAANAEIRDITFENITHTVNVGRVTADTTFGLFAGKIAQDTVFENVSVSGEILFGKDCNNLNKESYHTNYTVGIFAASGTPLGIDTSDIEVKLTSEEGHNFTVSVDASDKVTLVFNK